MFTINGLTYLIKKKYLPIESITVVYLELEGAFTRVFPRSAPRVISA